MLPSHFKLPPGNWSILNHIGDLSNLNILKNTGYIYEALELTHCRILLTPSLPLSTLNGEDNPLREFSGNSFKKKKKKSDSLVSQRVWFLTGEAVRIYIQNSHRAFSVPIGLRWTPMGISFYQKTSLELPVNFLGDPFDSVGDYSI